MSARRLKAFWRETEIYGFFGVYGKSSFWGWVGNKVTGLVLNWPII